MENDDDDDDDDYYYYYRCNAFCLPLAGPTINSNLLRNEPAYGRWQYQASWMGAPLLYARDLTYFASSWWPMQNDDWLAYWLAGRY